MMVCVSGMSWPSWKNVFSSSGFLLFSVDFSCQDVLFDQGEESTFLRLTTARFLKGLSQTLVHQPLKDVLNVLEGGRIGVEVRPTDVIGCLSRTLMSMLQATNDSLKRLKAAGRVGLGRVVEGRLVARDELIDGIRIQGNDRVCVGIRNFRL